ncbi:N-acyl homoserine lactonase family protein [Actinomycetospora sp. TBRC 11914]|uniref:N-acyl homoserine lactonase family protein n=1 Tax=Actinomycetospora sp. TBRC 11914 TaxID=2729387 RepID=UPI00145E5A66|nr:N-acyl homoserine lactonase family protein [Actinomycetospora sp. TBRC 11914]NMO88425.1 N-acyl homoserine lactonase family protein [Actinomycetospora sp. TBRC 11914]
MSGGEVLAVRYGTRTTTCAESYLNWHVYREPDAAFTMDYFFWVVRDATGRTTLLDCGFAPDVGRRRNRDLLADPVAVLDALGIDPGSLERLVVSHAHYDHIGNLDRFPAAEVVMTRRELEFWSGPHAARVQFAHSTEPDELATLARARDDGRVTTFDGHLDLGGGVELIEVGGHTPGQLVALAPVPGGRAVLAADALHFYDELTADRPFFVVADLAAMYAGFDLLGELAAPADHVLVAGHDAEVGRRFPGRVPGTDDLAIRIEVDA